MLVVLRRERMESESEKRDLEGGGGRDGWKRRDFSA
jgi:hypothetical protein